MRPPAKMAIAGGSSRGENGQMVFVLVILTYVFVFYEPGYSTVDIYCVPFRQGRLFSCLICHIMLDTADASLFSKSSLILIGTTERRVWDGLPVSWNHPC